VEEPVLQAGGKPRRCHGQAGYAIAG